MRDVTRICWGRILRAVGGARTVPCVASVALHAGVLVVGSQGLAGRPVQRVEASSAELAIELEPEVMREPEVTAVPKVLPEPLAVPSPVRPAVAARAPSLQPHQHPYPVAASHDSTPHDPSEVHAAADVAAPEGQSASEAPALRPRFVLRATGALATAATSGASEKAGESEYSASAVDQPARLRAAAAAAYPELARASEIEADVPLEIVVDSAGAVVSARALAAPGYGLEAAALSTARAYRFTPARRAGRAVRVRMRCSVSFRLR